MPKTEPKTLPFPSKGEDSQKNSNGYRKPTYIRCDLTADQKKEMAEWANMLHSDDLLEYIENCVKEGYVISIKEIEKGYQTAMTQTRDASILNKNTGKSLVSRASSPTRALWSIFFKHIRVMEEDWSRGNEDSELEW